jgi:hypothetical protein
MNTAHNPKTVNAIRARAAKLGVSAEVVASFLAMADEGRCLLVCHGNSRNARLGSVAFFINAECTAFITLKRSGQIQRSDRKTGALDILAEAAK